MKRSRRYGWLTGLVLIGTLGVTFCRGDVQGESKELAELMLLESGSVVADLGAGDGEWSQALARRVGPSGRVIATEVDEKKLDRLHRLARRDALSNLVVVSGDQSKTGLTPACCDAILVRLVYHHFEEPESMQRDFLASLKPGGRIVIVDFPPDRGLPRRSTPEFRGGHGIAADQVIQEMTAAGFQLLQKVEQWQGDDKHYLLLFEKPR